MERRNKFNQFPWFFDVHKRFARSNGDIDLALINYTQDERGGYIPERTSLLSVKI